MGIKHLNGYLKRTCKSAMCKVSFWDLRGKIIVIDASIYMYRFASQDMLIEGIYQLTMMLLENRVTPIYIFDGPPPPEKADVIQQRRHEREEAHTKYEEMKALNDIKKMKMYKRRSTRIKRSEVDSVKELLTLMGVTWCQASGEADQLCAYYMKTQQAWACMSEDTDLLVYGCERVLRYVSIFYGTSVLYDVPKILELLDMSLGDFQSICIAAGSEYGEGENLYSVLNKFHKNQQTITISEKGRSHFIAPPELNYEKNEANAQSMNGKRSFLKKHGFVFVNDT